MKEVYSADNLKDFKRLLYLRRGNEYLLKDDTSFKNMEWPLTLIHKTFANYPKLPHEFNCTPWGILNTALVCTECDLHSKQLGLNRIKKWLIKNKIKFEECIYYEDYEQFIFDFSIKLKDNSELLLNYNDTERCINFMSPNENTKELRTFCLDNEFNLFEIFHTDFDSIEIILDFNKKSYERRLSNLNG